MKFSEFKPGQKVPGAANCLIDEEARAHLEMAEGDGSPKFEMTAYSGKPILGHWYWGNLSIDLEGIQLSKDRYPVLQDHFTDLKVGHSGKPVVEDGTLKIHNDNFKFVDTAASAEFIKTAKDGFPWQASISGRPSVVERLEEGESAVVNGHKLNGPGSIWRKWQYRESSVTTFGADSNTKSAAFTEAGEDIEVEVQNHGKGGITMPGAVEIKTIDQFKEANPEAYKAFVADLRKEIQGEFQGQLDELTAERDKKASEINALSEKVEEQGKEIKVLVKDRALRHEKELEGEFSRLMDEALAESDIPPRLYPKVKGMLSYSDFVADDKLNVEKASEAIQSELKDWEGRGATNSVLGGGTPSREMADTPKDQQKLAEEDDARAQNLASMSGRTLKK